MKVTTLIALLFVSTCSLAFSRVDFEELGDCLKKVKYTKGYCEQNSYKLLARCMRSYSKQAQVHFLINNRGSIDNAKIERPVRPKRAKLSRGSKTLWGYHVFVEIEGHIIDLDYDSSSQITPVHEYFENMYFEQDIQSYTLKTIQADKYLLTFNQARLQGILESRYYFDYLTRLEDYLKLKSPY